MKYLLTLLLVFTLAAPSFAEMTLNIQLKAAVCADTNFTPEETAYWKPCLRASAIAVQQLNVMFADLLVDGLIPSNPDSETVEGYLGDINTPPNSQGVVTVRISQLTRLKIPYIPEGLPFIVYMGPDATERVQVGTDPETGDPIYETVNPGTMI